MEERNNKILGILNFLVFYKYKPFNSTPFPSSPIQPPESRSHPRIHLYMQAKRKVDRQKMHTEKLAKPSKIIYPRMKSQKINDKDIH